MQVERLKILLEYLADEPNEPFNIYAVAMEYLNKDNEEALFYLEKLLKEYSDYIPTYYHAAALFFEKGDWVNAENTYKIGIEKAHQQPQTKAFDELKRAYRMFLDEIED